jgi:hypothetical protein
MLLKFTFKNIGSHQETVIQEDFSLETLFFEILKQILQRYLLGIALDQITIITQNGDYLKNEDLIKSLTDIIEEYQVEFTIVKREEVNGPILSEPLNYLKGKIEEEKIESKEAEIPEEVKITEEDSYKIKMHDEQLKEMEFKMRDEIKSKEKEIDREMLADIDEMKELMEAKKKVALKAELQTLSDSSSGLSAELKPTTPPPKPALILTTPSAPPTPVLKSAPPAPPGSIPFPPPSPASTTISTPEPMAVMPPPPPPAESRESYPPMKAKEESSGRRMHRERAKSEKRADGLMMDEEVEEEVEAPKSLLELKEETAQEFKKHLSIEYFDRMNPEKYYPLIVDIADVKQALKAAEENVFTGERKIQKQEDMTVVLKSTIVTVEPLFPGCVVTPAVLTSDFSLEQDIVTFYITPLVSDDLKECKIQFLDSERHVIYSIATPTKVDDPRYAKAIATYGTIASILPKALILFGIDIGESIQLTDILPVIQGMFGAMKLTDFIGIAGAILFVLIGVIVFLKRRPRKVKRSFKVGDIRSAAASMIKEILK